MHHKAYTRAGSSPQNGLGSQMLLPDTGQLFSDESGSRFKANQILRHKEMGDCITMLGQCNLLDNLMMLKLNWWCSGF